MVNAAPPNEPQLASTAKLATTPTPAVATVIFEVPRPPAIVACNNEEVRVTVGLIDLQPSYDYVTVPKRSLSAFLKAHVKNSSNFYILPGQTNIYSDNTFIGKVRKPLHQLSIPTVKGFGHSNIDKSHGSFIPWKQIFYLF